MAYFLRLLIVVLGVGVMGISTQVKADSASYTQYYQSAYNECMQSATEEGLADCRAVVAGCLKNVFQCSKDQNDCSVKSDGGVKTIECVQGSPSSCLLDLKPVIQDLFNQGVCDDDIPPGALTMSQPGCGNRVLELDETCDDGNTLDGDDCPSGCFDPAMLCGNGTLDPGEQCDAGTENGKVASGCDVQCKSFSSGDTSGQGSTQSGNAQGQSEGATGNCSLHPGGSGGTAIPLGYVALFFLSTVLLIFRRV